MKHTMLQDLMEGRYMLVYLIMLQILMDIALSASNFQFANPLDYIIRANLSLNRALNLEGKDSVVAQDSYYPYPAQIPGGTYGPPPVYGPPPEGPILPTGDVEIEFAFDELILRCIVEEPLEHIIWTRYPCPNQYFFGEGIPVADGATVYNEDLYDVQIVGNNGVIVSELLMKDPLSPESSGLYRCEAWPHYRGNQYGTYGVPVPVYAAAQSDVFIIGGNELLEECYQGSMYPIYNKLSQNTVNKKQDHNHNKDNKIKINRVPTRKNNTKIINRKESNAKYLRYNLKFDNDSIFDGKGINVTSSVFRPSVNFPFQPRNSNMDVERPPTRPVSPDISKNLSSYARFDFLNSNQSNQSYNIEHKKISLKVGKEKNNLKTKTSNNSDSLLNNTIH